MRTRIPAALSLSLSLVALAACDRGAPSPEQVDEKVVAVADASPTGVDEAAGAEADEIEGECLHGKAHEAGGCGGADAVPAPGSEGHFGAPFALAESTPLAAAVSGLEGEATVRVAGEVTSVCQAKGCWMVIKDHEDASVTARILMKDHAFSVPMDGTGKKAVVEGQLVHKTLTEGQVKHLAKDAGDDPAAVEGERKEFVLTASAVKLES